MEIRNYRTGDLVSCRSLWGEMVKHHRDIYDDQSIGGDDPGLEFDELNSSKTNLLEHRKGV